MITTLYQLRTEIPLSALQHGIAHERLPIWSVVETVIETQYNSDGTEVIATTEREIAMGLALDTAIRRMIETLKLLVTLSTALAELLELDLP